MPKFTDAVIADLSTEEHLSLIDAPLDSLPDAEAALPEAQRQELDRRLQLFEQEKGTAATWESRRLD